MQAHKNALVVGITTAVVIIPAASAGAQVQISAIEQPGSKVAKPVAHKPQSWSVEAGAVEAAGSAIPETVSETVLLPAPEAIAIIYWPDVQVESIDAVAETIAIPTTPTASLGQLILTQADTLDEGAPLEDGAEIEAEDPGVSDELEAAEEVDLESVTDFLDEDPATETDIPDVDEPTPDDPLSQPLPLQTDEEAVSDEQPDAEGAAEIEDDPAEDQPSVLVQDVLEALRAPANPLFFPTDPEAVEVTENVPVTLAQALQVAYRNSRDLQTAQIQLEQAQASLREAQAQRLPTVSGRAEYSRSSVNQFTTSTTTSFTGEAITTSDTVSDTSNVATGTLILDYDLFTSGQRRASIRAAREARRLQELELEVVAEEIQLNVTQAYYDIQEADETVRINRDNLNEALISFRDAAARERAGVGTRFDRLQAQVEVANARQDLRNAISNQIVSQRQLVELLSLPPGLNVTAADPVDIAGRWQLSLAESLALAYQNRAELEQQLVQRELNRQQRKEARSATLPQLSLQASYQVNDLLDVTRSPTGTDNDAFSIGAQLDWLFFDGGASRARARREGLDIDLAETAFADTREAIRFEVEQAFFGIESNLENIETAQAAVQLAEESLRLARLRFQAGVGIQSDVIQAQTDLTEAEANLVTAILGYNRSLISIQRAVSNLPDNNLSDIPPGNI